MNEPDRRAPWAPVLNSSEFRSLAQLLCRSASSVQVEDEGERYPEVCTSVNSEIGVKWTCGSDGSPAVSVKHKIDYQTYARKLTNSIINHHSSRQLLIMSDNVHYVQLHRRIPKHSQTRTFVSKKEGMRRTLASSFGWLEEAVSAGFDRRLKEDPHAAELVVAMFQQILCRKMPQLPQVA